MNNIMNIATPFIWLQQLMQIIYICAQKPKIGQILIKLDISLHGKGFKRTIFLVVHKSAWRPCLHGLSAYKWNIKCESTIKWMNILRWLSNCKVDKNMKKTYNNIIINQFYYFNDQTQYKFSLLWNKFQIFMI
jgi:hypothetical protein